MQQVSKYVGRKRQFFLFRQSYGLTGWAISWQGVLFSLLGVGGVTFVLFQSRIAAYNVNMVYILLTLAATVLFGLSTGVLTAVVSFLCFDYFFIDPFYTLFENFQDFVAVVLFLSTALITNQLLGWARLHSFQADARSREVTSLYELARTVISYIDREEMLWAVLDRVAANFEAGQCYLFLPEENSPDRLYEAARIVNTSSNERPSLDQAQAIYDNQPAAVPLSGPEFSHLPEDESGRIVTTGPVIYLPLQTTKQRLGVLALVNPKRPENPDSIAGEKRLLVVFANHVALAVEHARLIRETTKIEALKESDKLKSALLASVSHDLRTPLTAIKTATSSLLDKEIAWTEQGRDEFLIMIDLEVNRLTGLVSNLLDLSRIESGALQPNFGWYYLPEIIEGVAERLKNNRIIRAHPVTVDFAPDVPLTRMDFLQIDQVLTNLLENAAKYSAPGKPITVEVVQIEEESSGEKESAENLAQSFLQVNVTDQGFGIQPEEKDRIFEKFYRGRSTGSNLDMPGAGIGLAIARGIVEAHGGHIWAERHPEGGAVFSFTLPVATLPADEEELAEES